MAKAPSKCLPSDVAALPRGPSYDVDAPHFPQRPPPGKQVLCH